MSQETELIKKLSIAGDELVIEWHDGRRVAYIATG